MNPGHQRPMENLDSKAEQEYTVSVPQTQESSHADRSWLTRRARIALLSVAVAATLGLHLVKDILYAPEPVILVYPAHTAGPEFDWHSVRPHPTSPCTLNLIRSRIRLSCDRPPILSGPPAMATNNARASCFHSTTSPKTHRAPRPPSPSA